jgi:hypothetical protein
MTMAARLALGAFRPLMANRIRDFDMEKRSWGVAVKRVAGCASAQQHLRPRRQRHREQVYQDKENERMHAQAAGVRR